MLNGRIMESSIVAFFNEFDVELKINFPLKQISHK